MATKKISKSGNYNINITKNSKDTVYVLKDSSLASSVSLNFNRENGYNSTYSRFYKNGNDLVITVVYDEKLITNTIKDYFLYDSNYPSSLSNPNFVKVDNSSIGNPNNIFKSYVSGFFSNKDQQSAVFLGSKGSDTYLISKPLDGGAQLDDFGGNDSYNIQASYTGQAFLNLTDYFGNDNYNMSNNTNVFVKDKKGSDIYKANGVKKVDIADDDGNDKYTMINSTKSIKIADSKGKDIYEINASGDVNSTITDKTGNDKYLLLNGARIFKVIDESGNDSYEYVAASKETAYIEDKAGNDNYNFSSVDNQNITDDKGNDKYNFSNINMSNTSYSAYIHDNAGKDNYTVNVSNNLTVIDKVGDDKYNILNSKKLVITDGEEGSKKGGNDKYILNNVNQVGLDSISNQYNITDFAGKDSYNITNGSKIRINDNNTDKKTSADKYDISVNSQARIYDQAGNDTYKVNTSRGYITDYSGNDKYNIVDGNNFFEAAGVLNTSIIDDSEGNDSYNISNSTVTLGDNVGNDNYTISSNSNVDITDLSSSNDTYKINSMNNQVKIDDKGGTKDKLTLSNVNKDNLIFMADFDVKCDISTTDDFVNSGALIIFDKTNNGFIKIENFFETFDTDRGTYIETRQGHEQKGTGYIETINVGKKNISKDILAFANYNDLLSLAGEVGSWLCKPSHEYDSVGALLDSGNTLDIADFILTMGNLT